ncbi:MAG: hypothetical protein V3T83_15800 [Acidobacteriota bacterium]
MLALVVSMLFFTVGLAMALSYHFAGLTMDRREAERLKRACLGATRGILRDLASPAHSAYAKIDPSYTRDVVLFALDQLHQDLSKLARLGGARLWPMLAAFRLYLAVFRLKAHFRASLGDARRCIGFELFLLRWVE